MLTIEVPNDNRRALSNGEDSTKPGSLTYPLAKISFFFFFPKLFRLARLAEDYYFEELVLFFIFANKNNIWIKI